MKKIVFFVLTAFMLLQLVGCENNSKSVQETYNQQQEEDFTHKNENDETSDYQEPTIPEHVTSLFNQYNAILSSGNYNLKCGEKILEDSDSNWYNFALIPLEPDDILSYPHVSFYREGDVTERSFSVDLIDESGYEYNAINKEIIYVNLLATNPTEKETTLKEVHNNLINSYDGVSDSDIFELGNYKYFIEYTNFSGLGASITLNVISKEEINISIDKNQYTEYEKDAFLAELNVGEKAIIKGSVVYISEDDYHYTLCVVDGSSKYYVYYDPSTFPNCFEEDCSYIFYGTITSSQDMESGCLRLDYFETE